MRLVSGRHPWQRVGCLLRHDLPFSPLITSQQSNLITARCLLFVVSHASNNAYFVGSNMHIVPLVLNESLTSQQDISRIFASVDSPFAFSKGQNALIGCNYKPRRHRTSDNAIGNELCREIVIIARRMVRLAMQSNVAVGVILHQRRYISLLHTPRINANATSIGLCKSKLYPKSHRYQKAIKIP